MNDQQKRVYVGFGFMQLAGVLAATAAYIGSGIVVALIALTVLCMLNTVFYLPEA
jgi:chromate transport protein ChrA